MRKSVRAVIVNDGRMLLMKRSRDGHKFYTLVGGGIDEGETPEQALLREVREESSIEVRDPKLIATLNDSQFGEQLIYLCDYMGGTPALTADSGEATQNEQGTNLYEPLWIALGDLAEITLLPHELKFALLKCLDEGFPEQPIELKIAS
jgi:8-oxo-dGTP diphosphatase